jgi:hypothetical protein
MGKWDYSINAIMFEGAPAARRAATVNIPTPATGTL